MDAGAWIALLALALTVVGAIFTGGSKVGELRRDVDELRRSRDSTDMWRRGADQTMHQLAQLPARVEALGEEQRRRAEHTDEQLGAIRESLHSLTVNVGRLEAFREASAQHRAGRDTISTD